MCLFKHIPPINKYIFIYKNEIFIQVLRFLTALERKYIIKF